MITALYVKGAPCFPSEGVRIEELNAINFFFGPNGTGKTTISRALKEPGAYLGSEIQFDVGSSRPEIRVYNRDYVHDTFGSAKDLPGVFLLGLENKAARQEIDELTGKDGKITTAKAKLTQLEETLSDKTDERNEVRKKLTEAAWKKRDKMPIELEPMFQGFKGSKETFTDKLLESAEQVSGHSNLEKLINESKSAFDEMAKPIDELGLATFPDLSRSDGANLVGEELVGSKEVTLSQLIEELGNSDWVAKGQTYLEKKPETCPFCQQDVSTRLLAELAEYFDTKYSTQIDQLGEYVANYKTAASNLSEYVEDLVDSQPDYLDAPKLELALSDLRAASTENLKRLERKLDKPSRPSKVDDLAPEIEAVNMVIQEANAAIGAHNSKVGNRAKAKSELVASCWAYFCGEVVKTELAVYDSSTGTLDKGIEALEKKISSARTMVDGLEARLRELEGQVVTSKKTIGDINALLDAVGFSSFNLAESDKLQDGYQLQREDGTTVYETLSEGEKTFITFLYFFHELQGQPSHGDGHMDLVAVVDDPISSLDSDIMFVISQLLRKLMMDITEQTGRVRQLVVLTHNAYFHKEVTFLQQGDKGAGRRFYVVRRKQDGRSCVVGSSDNPIKTSYSRLWEEIQRAKEDSGAASVGLQNTMRRIIETYFRILGGISNEKILAEFAGSELVICRSLLSWLHEGSHSIIEEIDYSPSEHSVDLYLEVFKRIFEVMKQTGHYEMMLKEQDPIPLAG